MFSSLNAQTICGTIDNQGNNLLLGNIPDPAFSYSTDPAVLAAFPPVSFNVYFWGINRDDGSSEDRLTTTQVVRAVEMLNDAFAEMNICFNLMGYDYINETDIYQPTMHQLVLFFDANKNYLNNNSINIFASHQFYINGRTLQGFNGPQHSVGISMDFINGGILIHEIGHVVGLMELHGYGYGGGYEHVTRDPNDPNYNAKITGDHVTDTNAARSFFYGPGDMLNNNCEYNGNATDNQGTPYIITENETKNYMAYTFDRCREIFTTGQGIRVRETIDTGYAYVKINQSYDLVIRNSVADVGAEPDIHTEKKQWNSPDIWLIHGIPPKKPVIGIKKISTAYVRVTNKGCTASSGNDKVVFYWSRSNMYNELREYVGELQIREPIDTMNIPVIQPGQEVVLEFQCETPKLSDYYGIIDGQFWSLSLTAKIDPQENPIYPYRFVKASDFLENNNLAVKNVSPDIVINPIIVNRQTSSIESMSPNPAFDHVAINYEIGDSNSAYLKITKANSTISNNYTLNEAQSEITLDISSYSSGIYIVSLICNGQVTDSKNLIIQ